MAKNRRSKKNRKRSKNGIGKAFLILGAAIALTVLIGSGVFLSFKTEKEIALDKQTLCPETGARATVAVLLDTTDELALVTKNEVKTKILEIQKSLPRHYQVSVYTLNESGLKSEPIAQICNPGRLDQRDEFAQKGLTANPVLIEKKYREFETTVSKALDNIFQKKFEAKLSPLLSSLQDLSSVLPRPTDVNETTYPSGKNRIIFVTDFVEHTEVFSIYKSGINITAFKKSRATEKFGKSYSDVDLEFLLVRRNIGGFSTLDLAKFWAQVFAEEFKSNIASLKILPGEI